MFFRRNRTPRLRIPSCYPLVTPLSYHPASGRSIQALVPVPAKLHCGEIAKTFRIESRRKSSQGLEVLSRIVGREANSLSTAKQTSPGELCE